MRREIPGDPISIAYGYDELTGVFLAVVDRRLKFDCESSDEVNTVTESIGVRDGGGSYFDLHTGQVGFGQKVDDDTMATFLRRFGVSDDEINELPLHCKDISCKDISYWRNVKPGSSKKRVGSSRVCTTCRVRLSSCNFCSVCHLVPYCGKKCQREDWKIHKLFCALNPQQMLSSSN